MADELGKIREGSPRVYRDRIVGRRGECRSLPPSQSSDRLDRFVFHPDDIDEAQRALAEWAVDDLVRAINLPESDRPTVYGLRITGSTDPEYSGG